MTTQRDPYEVLGVSRGATADDIRKSYLKLAHKYHPDKTGGDKAAEDKLKEINASYDILKNPDKRKQYDRFGHMGETFTGASPGGAPSGAGFESPFEDLFDMFFDRSGGRGRRRPTAMRGHDLEYRIAITLREAATGISRSIDFARMENCADCSGTGAAPGSQPETCSRCQGSGQVRMAHGFFSVTQTCHTCRGTGRTISKPCGRCSGAGQVRSKRELSVDIPAGVDTGSRLRVAGEGEPGEGGGPRGDLYIAIEVKADDIFVRDGNSIICEFPVSFTQAALGATVRVPTLKGEAHLKIPAGTQSGAALRLRKMGMPDVRGYGQGDQIVRVIVEIPSKLNRKQRELLQEFETLSDAKSYPLYRRFMERLKKFQGG